ncbi:cyclohydrolase [Lentinula aciculospora]|uniref:Cyclohydrolase n=1 Tax=Lentinula aciculospora TaxID=153920 RepID=A0A9W9AP36_9AGAR|nr:cyclohydrolase [Lentinula aciculospora]
MSTPSPADSLILAQILAQLQSLQVTQQAMQVKLDTLSNANATASPPPPEPKGLPIPTRTNGTNGTSRSPENSGILSSSVDSVVSTAASAANASDISISREKSLYPGRVLLTTYPSQHSISPYPLTWGANTPSLRGPIICSRLPSSLPFRNALGAHSGSYSIYRALSIAMGSLDPRYKPSYEMTEPPVDIPVCDAWFGDKKIVSMDPWGHLVPSVFEREIRDKVCLDIRPSISVTKAHIKLKEIDESVKRGEIVIDGKIVLGSQPLRMEDGSLVEGIEPGVEVNVSKAAVDPIWYLPGVAERFGISESLLRRALFEDTGGMYPELITRPDIKVFLPPIGGLTVYIFGNPAHLHDPSRILTVRVHDECNGSDVFGSDICTCKPYLTYAMEECIRTAQGRHGDQISAAKESAKKRGASGEEIKGIEKGEDGVGVVVYFRKEGRALGEVTKYLVYNLRKRGGDSADRYFKSTELVAGVKDMRFQALMPDVLHWLGITKIDNMVSMSDMKYDAIVGSGIEIRKRYDIPSHLIPPDSRVEIDAKIASGYFSSGKQVTQEDLKNTVGRAWEEVEH